MPHLAKYLGPTHRKGISILVSSAPALYAMAGPSPVTPGEYATLNMEAGLGAGDYQELFAVNPPNAVIAAYLGRADACGVGDVVTRLPIVRARSDPEQLRALATSAPVPHLPWAVSAEMPEALKERVQSLLLDLAGTEEGRQVLESAQLTGLNPANDADYAPHRAIVGRVFSESE